MKKGRVLLTGVSGFLGSHTAIQLLNKGYEVVGTVRDLSRSNSIREIIGKHTANVHQLSFVKAELEDANVWGSLTRGIDYVQHVASPFPRELPRHEDELIVPAKEGVLNILTASSANQVKRVVLTSSTAAMIYGKDRSKRDGIFNEGTWTNVGNRKDTTAYFRSKTIAEQAAWTFMNTDTSGMELATVCPGGILGPVLEDDFGTSANIVIKMMDGSIPALPDIGFDMVDVRSVAELLILAMEQPQAANQRYAGSAGYMKFKDVAAVLRAAYPGRKIPKSILPDFAVRLFSNFDRTLKPVLHDLGVARRVDHSKAERELGWKPLSNREAVLSCAESILELGLIK